MEFTQREVVLVNFGACLYIARSGREQFANDRKTV